MPPLLTEAEFKARLAALGLVLDSRAFAAAWSGAQRLRAEMTRVDVYLAQTSGPEN
jgi:hypothetical protein